MSGLGDVVATVAVELIKEIIHGSGEPSIPPNTGTEKSVKKDNRFEVQKVRMYSNVNGRRIYTENIYKNRNNGFGVELYVANRTRRTRNVDFGCCI